MDVPLVTKFQIHLKYHNALTYKVYDYLQDEIWSLSANLQSDIPELMNYIFGCFLPGQRIYDMLVWIGTENGELNLKHVYNFLVKPPQSDLWNDFP